MINKESSFTSTGEKMLAHSDAINNLASKKNSPIVAHVMPTERCNLSCSFCSVANRANYDDLSIDIIKYVFTHLHKLGLKAAIVSGGGEPILYKQFNELISFLINLELKIGLITNGIFLNKINQILDKFTWIRISANWVDTLNWKKIILPNFPSSTTVGVSYIYTNTSSADSIKKLKDFCYSINAIYCRLLPDCNIPKRELIKYHNLIEEICVNEGEPFFHQNKIPKQANICHLGRVHPVLYTDGRIYPCDSLVLNSPENNKKFHDKYSLCNWDEIVDFYAKEIEGSLINPNLCPKCVFVKQNEIINKIINKELQYDPNIKFCHEEFI